MLAPPRRADRSGAPSAPGKPADVAPSFSLRTPKGTSSVRMSSCRKAPLVVSFYRGSGCPYCNKWSLQALEAAQPGVRQVWRPRLAISPQDRADSRNSVRQNKLPLPDPVGRERAKSGRRVRRLRFERRTI